MGESTPTILEIVSASARKFAGAVLPEDDLRQEMFVAVWQSREKRGLRYSECLEVEGDEVGLLREVCRRRFLNLWRDATRQKRWAPDLAGTEPQPVDRTTPYDWSVAGELEQWLFAQVDLSQPVLAALVGGFPGLAERIAQLQETINRVNVERLWGLALQEALGWNQRRLRRVRNQIENRVEEWVA